MSPNPGTSVVDTKVKKLFHLQTLAKHIPDGFSTDRHIIHNAILGKENSLPSKCRKLPTTISLAINVLPDPSQPNLTSLAEAKAVPDWPQWQKAIKA